MVFCHGPLFIGIYLDETDKLDSEVADLYLNQKAACPKKASHLQPLAAKDDDQESGSGLSLPQSPVTAPLLGDIQLSLCGLVNTPLTHKHVIASFLVLINWRGF